MHDDELRVIGNVEIRAGGEPVELAPQLAKALAVLAAARPGQSVPRSDLLDALWPSAADPDRLWPVLSKLRPVLRRIGLTVSYGRGHAGYMLRRLPDPHGVEPSEVLDLARVQDAVVRGERLLDAGRPAEAVVELRAAAARRRGEPFGVGDDWPLPRICRAAADRLGAVQRRLARAWARAGLLLGGSDALDWIDQDKALAAALDGDRDVWLLRFVAALSEAGPSAAEALLEERRPGWGYDDPTTVRAGQLLELGEHGARLRPARPPQPSTSVASTSVASTSGAPASGPHSAQLTAYVAAVPSGLVERLAVLGPTGPARTAVVEELTARAERAGVRVVRAVCDAADDLAPGRPLMRDLWAAALTDPRYPPQTDRAVLTGIVANPRPPGGSSPRTLELLVDAAVALVTALARSRPVLVVIDDAHRLTELAADLTERIRSRLTGVAAGFCLAGADAGPFVGQRSGTVLRLPDTGGAPAGSGPDAGDWLAAAAVTAVELDIDPVAVAAVLGVPAAVADAGLAAAVRSAAVLPTDPPRFADTARRDRVLTGLAGDPGRSRRLHAAAHRYLTGPARARTDPARVARCALAARPDVDDDRVAAACLAAARSERAARRHESAVELAVRGLAVSADPAVRFALQIAIGDARHDRAQMHAAETAYRAAYEEAGDSPRLRAVAAVRLGRRWMDPGQLDGSLLHLLRTARDGVAGADDRESQELWLQLGANLAHWSTMGVLPAEPLVDIPDGVRLARSTLRALGPDTTPEVACEVLTECRYALYDFVPPAEARTISARLEHTAAAAGSVHFRWEALIQTVVDHLRLGDLVAAHAASERHRELVARTGHGMGPWSQLAVDTIFDLWEGDLAAAQARVLGPMRAMLDEHPRDVSDSMRQTWMGQLFWLRHQQGRLGELAEVGVLALVQRRQYFVVWSPAMALLRGQLGQPAAAVDQLAAMLDLTAELRALPPHGLAVPTLAVAAEAIDSLRGFRNDRLDVDDLARRVDELLEPHTDELALAGWPTVLVGPVRRARGLLALATGRPEQALEHFERGIDRVGAAPAQLGWLRLHQARALRARGAAADPDRARQLLASVQETAARHGLAALADATRRELAEPDGP